MGGRVHVPIPAGTIFGRLTVLDFPPRLFGKGNYQYFCKCDCGTTDWFYSQKIKSGHTISCGCFRAEQTTLRNKQRN